MKKNLIVFLLIILTSTVLVGSYMVTRHIRSITIEEKNHLPLVEGHDVVFKHKNNKNQITTLHAGTCVYNETKSTAALENISLLSKKNGTIVLKLKAAHASYKTNTKDAVIRGLVEGVVFGGTLKLEDPRYLEKSGTVSSDKKMIFIYDTFSVRAASGAYCLDSEELVLNDVETVYALQSTTTHKRRY